MNKVIENIKHHILIYILEVAVIISGVIYIADQKCATPKRNVFSIFISSDTFDAESLHSYLKDTAESNDIKELRFYKYSPEDESNYNTYLESHGVAKSDLMFVTDSLVKEDSSVVYCTQPYRNGNDYGTDMYSKNETNIAIKVYDYASQTGLLTDIIDYELDEDYYLVIGKNSYHYNEYKNNDVSILKTFIDKIYSYGK